jgi:tetratricopeptide (TPR) repeat protein
MSGEAAKMSSTYDSLHGPTYSARVRLSLATVLRLSERLVERLVSAYDNAFRLDNRDAADLHLGMATSFLKGGKAEDALAALRQVIDLQPENGLAWFQYGLLQLQQGASASSVQSLEQARRLGFESFELYFYLAEALEDLERFEEAVETLVQALKRQPESAEATYRLGLALDRLGRYEEAIAVFKRAIDFAPREVGYYQSLGFTLECMGRRDEAIEYFKKALTLEHRTTR